MTHHQEGENDSRQMVDTVAAASQLLLDALGLLGFELPHGMVANPAMKHLRLTMKNHEGKDDTASCVDCVEDKDGKQVPQALAHLELIAGEKLKLNQPDEEQVAADTTWKDDRMAEGYIAYDDDATGRDSEEHDDEDEDETDRRLEQQPLYTNGRGAAVIDSHIVRTTPGIIKDKYGFDTKVLNAEKKLTVGLTKTGGRGCDLTKKVNGESGATTGDASFDQLLGAFGGRSSGPMDSDDDDDERDESSRIVKPRKSTLASCPPDMDPNTVFDCRCEYPVKRSTQTRIPWHLIGRTRVERSMKKNGTNPQRTLSMMKTSNGPTLPPNQKTTYRKVWDVDRYALVNGTFVLPRWHAACSKTVFICPGESKRSCQDWAYHCTTSDFPRKSTTINKMNRALKRKSDSRHRALLPKPDIQIASLKSAKRSRRNLTKTKACKVVVLPVAHPKCASKNTTSTPVTATPTEAPVKTSPAPATLDQQPPANVSSAPTSTTPGPAALAPKSSDSEATKTPTPVTMKPTDCNKTLAPAQETPGSIDQAPPSSLSTSGTRPTKAPTPRTREPTKATPAPTQRAGEPTKLTPTPTTRTAAPTPNPTQPTKATPAPTAKTPAPVLQGLEHQPRPCLLQGRLLTRAPDPSHTGPCFKDRCS
jgi:hypothetical protein